MPTPRDVLVSLQRFEFEKAAALDKTQLIIQLVISIFTVASQYLPKGLSPIAAVASLLLVVVTFFFLHHSNRYRSIGEKARRATLLVDGLGLHLSIIELRRMAALSGQAPQELAKWNDAGYFDTTEPPGVPRAVSMLEESAFWSANLFRASAERMQIWLVVSGLAMLVCLLLSLSPAVQTVFHAVGDPEKVRIFSSLASSLVFVEVLLRVLRYRAAARETEEVLIRLGPLKGAADPRDDFYTALLDYNSAVEGAPMMAPGVWEANHEKLDAEWKANYGSVAGAN
jgi:membrane protein YdbS with pleckstrin-like domain